MKLKALIIAWFILPGILTAQEAGLTLSITGAMDYALQHNRTYLNAKDDVILADAQYKDTRGSGLPQVKGSVEYMTYFNYQFAFSFGGSDEPPQIDYTKLDQGDVEILKILDQFTSSGDNTIIMGDQLNANVQVSQLILSGQYWVGLEMAKLGIEIRKKSLSLTALDIKQQVTNSYYLVLVTKRLLDVINANETNLQQIAKHTQNLFDAGMAESTDVDQIRINLSMLANSKRAMERNLELNYNMLRMLLGVDPGTLIELTEDLDSILMEVNKSNLIKPQFDIFSNLTYQIMEDQEILGEKSMNMQKWAFAPTLAGFYSYKNKIMSTAFDLSPNHAAGFTLSVPIFSGFSRQAQLSKARIELDKATRNKELLEQQLGLQKNQLTFALNGAYDNFITQQQNVEVAQRILANIQNKFQHGLVSSLDLTQANGNYLQAENNYVSSILELLKSKLELDKLYNTL